MAEVASVDRADHLAEHAGGLAVKIDLRVESVLGELLRPWSQSRGAGLPPARIVDPLPCAGAGSQIGRSLRLKTICEHCSQ